ncbi:MAG: aminopeptidase [Proteobacteria bacterium]|nr:aminopeptidase [Pseudomonadota bacterium]
MLKTIAAFEAKYQLRSPLAAATALIFFLLAFSATTIDQIQIGSGSNVHVNSPRALLEVVGILNIFGLFAITAFVANVVIRDDETGFAPIIRATRITKPAYLLGRFAGAFAVAFVVMLAVPLGVLVGSWMPWVDPAKLGPFVATHYFYAVFVMGLPTLLVMATAFFAVATATRSMLWTYLGVVAFLVLFVVTRVLLRDPANDVLAALTDPFGMSPLTRATRYWTATERNTLLPPLEGLLLANRLIWLGISAALFALAYALFRVDGQPLFKRRAKPAAPAAEAPPPPRHAALPAARSGMGWAQLLALTRFDMAYVFKSPAFFVLLALGLFNSWGNLSTVAELRGVPYFPVTRAVVQALEGAFTIIPFIVALFYAGELIWRDRQQRMHELIDSAPVPAWAHLAPKVLALTGVLLATYLAAVLMGVGYQLAHGYTQLELGHYLLWLVLPGLVGSVLLAVLALVLQVIAPSKPIGWGLTLLVLVAGMALNLAGWSHPLYNYGATPPVPLSDMNGMGRFWIGRAWLQAYWLAFAGLLLVLAYGLWKRGTQDALRPRLAQLGARLAGWPTALLAAFGLLWLAIGAWVFYNTNVLNTYKSSTARERELAAYEQALLGYAARPQPTITHVRLNVALYPREVRAVTQGEYRLENRTGAPLTEVHVRWLEPLQMTTLELQGATLAKDHGDFNYRIYHLATPMQPGEQRTLRFASVLAQQGFAAEEQLTSLVANGSFVNNMQISPLLGMDRSGLLQDRHKRRKYGLEPELRMAKLEDDAARAHHYLRKDSDWVTADLTVQTDADQTPVVPGNLVSDTTAAGRRTLHTRSEVPIQHFFSMQSARYAEGKASWTSPAGETVPIAVYHHPAHAHNVPLMLAAVQESLTLFSRLYSPYQFHQARIIEFPAYAGFAQAFAATVPYSEGIGFIQNQQPGSDRIDLVTYVTAHEFAHQWWAHQVIGADMQGSTLLSETFAQYSALRVMEQQHGPAMMRQFLKYELDSYLRARGSEVLEELPLARVENQPYIHYRKGALVMWTAKELLGADVVDAALRRLIQRFAFQAAPYPRSSDFIALLREEAGPDARRQQLITDLFEKITLVDMRAENPSAKKLADGRWEVRFTVNGRKLYADGQGKETEAPLDEPFDIGVFSAEPGKPGFKPTDVLHSERRVFKTGAAEVVLVVKARPTHVGVDPQNTRIDRNSADNVIELP